MFFNRRPKVSWKSIQKGDFIIDVREPSEFRQHSVHGTENVPLSNIHSFITDKRVFVMCQSGMRSKRAVKVLRKKGIDAVNIEGGLSRYGR